MLLDAAIACVEEDGANVIYLCSTTMHQANAYLVENLNVPVINSGPLSYKIVNAMLDLGLAHSRAAYPRPLVPKQKLIHAMLNAARKSSDT